MPHLLCTCGVLFEAPPGPAFCPSCKKLHPLTAPKIKVECLCGAVLKAPASLAGKNAKCPTCGQEVRVPDRADVMESIVTASAPPPPPPSPPVRGVRRVLPLFFTLTIIPLVMSLFSDTDIDERLQSTISNNPKILEQLDKETYDSPNEARTAFAMALPDHRIEGAFLPRDTWTHWLFAGVAAAALWGAILLLYPLGNATSAQLWKIGIFTGTVGILLLLGLQYVAAFTQGWNIMGRSILVIVFYIVKFIGFSYRAALDPENGFLLSMLGFTFGVGLCEELLKSLPLIWHYRGKATLNLRGAIAWGLATGVGFGISEGITYSSDYYNGFSTAGIYVVRFVSCVALHAVWSGAAAVLIYRRQQEFRDVESWWGWAVPVLKVLAVVMVLHGLYDTLLKRDMEILALLTAVASFAWFFWYAERVARLDEPESASAPLTA
jgi:hypothetical protein